jgi:hypothetical protein
MFGFAAVVIAVTFFYGPTLVVVLSNFGLLSLTIGKIYCTQRQMEVFSINEASDEKTSISK